MIEKYKVCILTNEFPDDHKLWVNTLSEYNYEIDFNTISLISNDWLDKVMTSGADIFIARPPGLSDQSKQAYDERIYIIDNLLNKKIYPSLNEVLVYENKKFLSYFLKANDIPHPKTSVFYSKEEAVQFCNMIQYPVVAKFNIGASGSGVRILKNKEQAYQYIYSTFSGKGAPKRWGPNLEKGNWLKRGSHYLLHPGDVFKKIKLYKAKRDTKQMGYVIFQEYIEHTFEWRCVRIGDSFFAHKKLIKGEKASGAILKTYEKPPETLLSFIKDITDRVGFTSLAIDLFEKPKQQYYVNEMQCYFGQNDPYQMKIDDKMGRYKFVSNKWVFEEGDFAKNACYNLRVEEVLKLLKQN